MGQNRVITTRVSPVAYKKLLQKCADEGCSTYEYFRQLVHADVGLSVDRDVPEKTQTELIVENESDERRFEFRG